MFASFKQPIKTKSPYQSTKDYKVKNIRPGIPFQTVTAETFLKSQQQKRRESVTPPPDPQTDPDLVLTPVPVESDKKSPELKRKAEKKTSKSKKPKLADSF